MLCAKEVTQDMRQSMHPESADQYEVIYEEYSDLEFEIVGDDEESPLEDWLSRQEDEVWELVEDIAAPLEQDPYETMLSFFEAEPLEELLELAGGAREDVEHVDEAFEVALDSGAGEHVAAAR